MLEVNHIAKSFKGNTVLTDVSLQVKAGQLIHISGANGSGKSTLFKIITKLLEPDHGSVRIGKDDLIGALIENPGFLEFESMMTNLNSWQISIIGLIKVTPFNSLSNLA